MKSIPIIIPEKCDETPITFSIPKLTRLDKFAKALIGSGIGLALAGIISGVLNSEEEKQEKEKKGQAEDTP